MFSISRQTAPRSSTPSGVARPNPHHCPHRQEPHAMRLVAVLDDVPSAALTLHTAGQLAERLGGADLCVFHPIPTVDPDFQSPDEGLPDPAQQARFAQSVAAHASTLHQIFASWQATLHGSTHAHWLEQAGDIRTILPAVASTADFVVLGPTHPDYTQATRQIFATTLYATQAAVLITPPVAQGSLGLHPVVAWQNSPNLLRAVHSAMPLLLTARQVTILMGEHKPGTAPDPALLAQLRASGVAVVLERFALAGSGVGAHIRALATQAGADLLVMGAYGRPHFVEWLFGGPTVDLLASATWPILTQH
ncbi:universal stress protein [Acetobacter okinawensis]|uniref:universal stress protein n=1 Tax=Acetobacter okinawensis TaxID=1076594 RepID=UPI00209F6BB9|nr:universal stress protein [Acetobacter okinawensis]MCP1214072.1 universal stress protein [Acetobacter okinawensis]